MKKTGGSLAKEPETLAPAQGHQRSFRSKALVMVVAFGLFLDYCLYGAVIPLTPLSPVHVVGEKQLGILYGGYAVSAMLLPPLFGYFGDRLCERFLMVCGTLAQGVAAAL